MLTLIRHGRTLKFDDSGFKNTPYVYRPLTRGKMYEEPFLEYIRSLEKRGEYVDVGAHLGTHSVWFATMCPSTRVHSFEPIGRYAEVVRRNVAANALEDKVTVHQTGLGAEPGQATNYMSVEHQIGFVADAREGVTETFSVQRMDDAVQGPVVLIKLDVEGMEAEVLRGASRILTEHRPVIFAEAQSGPAARAIARQLALFGYERTSRVFNATPTHEYSTEPVTSWSRMRATRGGLLPVTRAARRLGAKLVRSLRGRR
jgi:FkbM family methyltransferase